MKLLLLTGAGASRNLAREADRMPLMADWSEALLDALDNVDASLANACGLKRGASGPEFEQSLGELLEWQRSLPLYRKFLTLGGHPTGSTNGEMQAAEERTRTNLDAVVTALNETLYAQFQQQRIDGERAKEAFSRLLRLVQDQDLDLMAATTNYDRSLEVALEKMGQRPDPGFVAEAQSRPRLDARGLVSRAKAAPRGTLVPVLHLHGAVGWFDSGGTVYDYFGDSPFNSSLGSPVVLYPDPAKDPTRDAVVSQLWTEFEEAVEWASHILVLGHSLHDPPVVQLLSVASHARVAVTYLDAEGRDRIGRALPMAHQLEMDFGPDLHSTSKDLTRWVRSH